MAETSVKMPEILYSDDDVVIVRKPAGVVCEHTDANDGLVDLLCKMFSDVHFHVVHRLDSPTVGVMVYAKNSAAAAALSDAFANGRIKKEYLAVTCGQPPESSGELFDLLYFDKRVGKSFPVRRQRKGVKDARLEYCLMSCVDTDDCTLSLLRVKLYTGRTHQIRVQFASRHMPLYADRKYGGRGSGNLALLCASLEFDHPKSGKHMRFECTPNNVMPWTLFDIGGLTHT